MRLPRANVLLTVTGVASTEKWSGLELADDVFESVSSEPSVVEILHKIKEWQDQGKIVLSAALFSGQPIIDDSNFVQIQVFVKINKTPYIAQGKIVVKHGNFLIEPATYRPASATETEVVWFGKCLSYFPVERHPLIQLSDDEKRLYVELQGKPTSLAAMNKLTLDYLNLASVMDSHRQNPAIIAPPYSSATLDADSANWHVTPAEVCKPYMPAPGGTTKSPARP